MNHIAQILFGQLGEGTTEGGLAGDMFHAADASQGGALLERLDELAGTGQIQNGFCQQGSCEGSSVDLLSVPASCHGRCDSLLDASDLQNLYQPPQSRRQFERAVLLEQGEEFLLDLLPIRGKLVDGPIDGVVWA